MNIKKRLKTIITALVVAALVAVAFNPVVAFFSRPESAVIVSGSTSVQPYAEILAHEFEELHSEDRIDIQGGGSSAGIKAVQSGAADIGMSSRALKEEEQGLWQIPIAKDGLAIIVHPKNPVNGLTKEQVRDIYSGKITSWSDIEGGKKAKIHIISREEGSGTRDGFVELVMGKECRINPKAIIQDSNGAIRQLVSNDPNAIGFISLGLVDDTVKALWLDGVEASQENIIKGDYKLFRTFLLVAKSKPEGVAGDFIDFVLSEKGQEKLSSAGLIPE